MPERNQRQHADLTKGAVAGQLSRVNDDDKEEPSFLLFWMVRMKNRSYSFALSLEFLRLIIFTSAEEVLPVWTIVGSEDAAGKEFISSSARPRSTSRKRIISPL